MEKETKSTKTYMFHYDLSFLPSHPEDWYGDFPVELTDEEFEELVQANKIWCQPEIKNQFSDLDGDDPFMHDYCPQILEKAIQALKDFATKNWSTQIVKELDQANIEAPDEAYEAANPEFFGVVFEN